MKMKKRHCMPIPESVSKNIQKGCPDFHQPKYQLRGRLHAFKCSLNFTSPCREVKAFQCIGSTEEGIAKTDRHRLRLAVVRERGFTQLASDARLLVAAEGKGVMEHVVLVDPDGAGFQSVGDTDRGVQVARVHSSGETVGGAVAETNGIFLVLELGNRADRPKNLLLHNLHIFGHVGEDGGLDEVALFAMALTANLNFGAFLPTFINVATAVSDCVTSKMIGGRKNYAYPMIRSYWI